MRRTRLAPCAVVVIGASGWSRTMQRPVMNPMFHDEGDASHPGGVRRRGLRQVVAVILRVLKRLVRLLLIRPFSPQRKLRIEDASPVHRFIRGLLYRLALMPVLMVVVIVALVYAGTHPPQVPTV